MSEKPPVALFATCLVDTIRPSVGFATARLLENAGFEVVVPPGQTCCGQPGYNAGDRNSALQQAMLVIEMLEPYPQVVVPSGSCAAMLIHHYPRLLADDKQWLPRAKALAEKTAELSQLLFDCRGSGVKTPPTDKSPPADNTPPADKTRPTAENQPLGRAGKAVAFHDACSGLRELGIGEQARVLLKQHGIATQDLERSTECCGFGGTFCMKYPQISARMADDKLDDAQRTGARTLCSSDLGCLLHLEGRARRRKLPLQFRHIAELLDGGP